MTFVEFTHEEILDLQERGLMDVCEDTGDWLVAYELVFPLGDLDQIRRSVCAKGHLRVVQCSKGTLDGVEL